MPESETIMILGDFNARVGRSFENWTDILGKNDIGNMNCNGQLLLEVCANQSLCVTNTFFSGKISRKTSWKHPSVIIDKNLN